jgi:hypothetical protein
MAHRRGRRMAMAAAGLATAAAPLVLGQQPAGAAVTTANGGKTWVLVTSSGAFVECTATLSATHNTDDPNHPRLSFGTGFGGQSAACFDIETSITATYKDSEGVLRTVDFSLFAGPTGGNIDGAYTATSVRADFHYKDCDPNRNASCDVTVTASPK